MATREDAADYLASLDSDEVVAFVAESLSTKRQPRPDPSAGAGGGEPSPRGSVAAVMAARREARAEREAARRNLSGR